MRDRFLHISKDWHIDTQYRAQVVPITSNTDKLYPSESYVTFRGKKSKAMADQIATVSKKRLIRSEGSISENEMEGIGKAITIQLAL